MKKLLIVGALVLALTKFGSAIDVYTMDGCKVVEVVGNSVTVMDRVGNLWDLEASGFSTGDNVKLKMSGMGTDFIEDDEILDIWEA